MTQPNAGSRAAAGAVTIVGLAAVWISIITSLPSQEELSANVDAAPVAVGSQASSVVRQAASQQSVPAPALDLSIPGVAAPAPLTEHAPISGQDGQSEAAARHPVVLDPRAAQVVRLKCEAEIEQLCPDSGEGPARARCMERRARELPLRCQDQLRERFVKWKEDRGRMVAACEDDVRRLCGAMKPGDGRVLQCLQDHSQEVSDRCHETLPKGTLLFRQQ